MKVDYETNTYMINFAGTAQEFKRKFEYPILRGRDADATENEHKRGQEKLQEVNSTIQYVVWIGFFVK